MEIPSHLHGLVGEAIIADQNAAFSRQETEERRGRWAVILGLRPVLDGDAWCVLWGPDLAAGICAFGPSPEAAIVAFDVAMRVPVAAPAAEGSET